MRCQLHFAFYDHPPTRNTHAAHVAVQVLGVVQGMLFQGRCKLSDCSVTQITMFGN